LAVLATDNVTPHLAQGNHLLAQYALTCAGPALLLMPLQLPLRTLLRAVLTRHRPGNALLLVVFQFAADALCRTVLTLRFLVLFLDECKGTWCCSKEPLSIMSPQVVHFLKFRRQ
jgi:hypothetical protein